MARKRRRRQPREKSPASVSGIVERAIGQIARGNGAHALRLLRRAESAGVPPSLTTSPFHVATLLRAAEYESKGYGSQAAAARERAAKYHLDVADRELMDKVLPQLLKALPDKDCFELYARHLRSNPAHGPAEVKLADRLVTKRCWEHVALLDADSQFRRDAGVMASVVKPLDAGDWQRGLEGLQPLGDRSAFRHWRSWCRVMTALCRNDGEALRRELRTIPSDFPLKSAVRALHREWKVGANRGSKRLSPIARLLGIGHREIAASGGFLVHAVQAARPPAIARAVDRFARAVDPVDPLATRMQVVLLLASELSLREVTDVCSQLKPPIDPAWAALRVEGQGLGLDPPRLPDVDSLLLLIETVEDLFSEEEQARFAKSSLLQHLAATVGKAGQQMPNLPEAFEDFDVSSALDGVQSWAQTRRLQTTILLDSIEAEPRNAEAHRQLIKLIEKQWWGSRRPLIEAYENYASSVPEDPEPWIGLAEVRLEGNAYRKAEEALKKARQLAGPDERVARLQGVSLLVATATNIRAGRYPLAEKDLASARSVETSETEPIIRAWDAVLQFRRPDGKQFAAACGAALEGAAPNVRAEALCFLLGACKPGSHLGDVRVADRRRLEAQLDESIAQVARLQPDRLAALGEPLPRVFSRVARPDARPEAMAGRWGAVLSEVPDSAMFRTMLAVLDAESIGDVRALKKELLRRVPRIQDAPRRRLLLLYLGTVRYLLDEKGAGDRLRRLQLAVPESEAGPLRASAERLAETSFVKEALELALALRVFDFSLLHRRQVRF